jgi:hypothetical protein
MSEQVIEYAIAKHAAFALNKKRFESITDDEHAKWIDEKLHLRTQEEIGIWHAAAQKINKLRPIVLPYFKKLRIK